MKTLLKFLTVIFCLSAQTTLFAQTEEEMKAWMDYMTPGPVHEMLAKSNGDWKADITMWMDPTLPPTKSTATANNKMILGGRYQNSTYSGDMMGMPFEGVSTIGFDNKTKKFYSTWIDNMGTGVMFMEGTWDEPNKTVLLVGKMVDPMTGLDCDVRETFKIIDDNSQFMEMFVTKEGKENKTMEMTLTRK